MKLGWHFGQELLRPSFLNSSCATREPWTGRRPRSMRQVSPSSHPPQRRAQHSRARAPSQFHHSLFIITVATSRTPGGRCSRSARHRCARRAQSRATSCARQATTRGVYRAQSPGLISPVRIIATVITNNQRGHDALTHICLYAASPWGRFVQNNMTTALVFLGVAAYILVGAAIMHALEGWPYHHAVQFCVVTVTTVGSVVP